MATMSLRLSDDDSALVDSLKETMQVGKNEVIRVAVRELAERKLHEARVTQAIALHLREDANVLRRLAEA